MAQIPTSYIGTNSFPDRPPQAEINPEQYGKDAHALAQLGGEIGDFGAKLMASRKRAMENEAVSQAHSDDIKWTADTVQNLRLSYSKKDADGNPVLNPDGSIAYNVDGYANALNDRMKERRAAQIDAMPTGDAQRSYMDATNRLFGAAYSEGLTWENVTKAQSYKQNFLIRTNADANYLTNQQDPIQAIKTMNDSIEQSQKELNGSVGTEDHPGVNTPGEAQTLFHEGARARIHGLLDGLTNNAPSARVGLELLNNISESGVPRDYKTGAYLGREEDYGTGNTISKTTDASGKETTVIGGGKMRSGSMTPTLNAEFVRQHLTADEISRARTKFEGVLQEGATEDKARLKDWANNLHAIVTSTDPDVMKRFPNAFDTVDGNIAEMKKLVADNEMTKLEYDKTLADLATGMSAQHLREQFPMMAPSKKAEFDKMWDGEYKRVITGLGEKDPVFALGDKLHHEGINNQVWGNYLKARDQDITSYVETFGKNHQGSLQNGIPDEARIGWRISQANDVLEHRGEIFAKPEIASLVNNFKTNAQTDPAKAQAQMWDMKERMGGYFTQGMDDLVNKGKLPGYFKDAASMDNPDVARSMIQHFQPEMKKKLEESVAGTEKKVLSTEVNKVFGTNGVGSIGLAFKAAGGLKTSQDLSEAVKLEAIDLHGANADMKWGDAVKAATDKVITSQYHIMGTAFMPRQIGNVQTSPERVNAQMQLIYKPEIWKDLDIAPPGGIIEKDKSVLANKTSLAIAKGRWVTGVQRPEGTSDTGATFMVPIGSGWTALRDKSGQAITVDFLKATQHPSADALNYQHSWWEKDVPTTTDKSVPVGGPSAAVPSNANVPDAVQQESANKLQISEDMRKKVQSMPLKGRKR